MPLQNHHHQLLQFTSKMTLLYLISFFAIALLASDDTTAANVVPFDTNYHQTWGNMHVLDQGTEVQLSMDQSSGGGFASKQPYGSGRIRASIKTPKSTKGVITAFYLTTVPPLQSSEYPHDEIDFELLGDDKTPYKLNTNVFSQDSGHREQQVHLWFDPTQDFHDYEILWNDKQIVFSLDGRPIRVYKNNTKIGARYPIGSPMYVQASIWNKTDWVGAVDWSKGPFLSHYRKFEINGCLFDQSNPASCYATSYEWNQKQNWQLNPKQQKVYDYVKRRALVSDYCKNPGAESNFPECKVH